MKLAIIIGASALVLWAIAVVYYFLRKRQVAQDLSRAQEEARAVLEKATAEANQIAQKASAEVNEKSRNFDQSHSRVCRLRESFHRIVRRHKEGDSPFLPHFFLIHGGGHGDLL